MPDVHRWQYQYLGTMIFPKTLSAVELRAFFTYSDEEIAALRTRYRPALRVGAAVQLGFLKMTGSLLQNTQIIPAKLLRHVSAQLDVPALTIASLRAIYKRPQTRYEHQWWAMELLGFSKASPKQQQGLLLHLRQEAGYAPSVDDLVARGKLWLYQHRYLILVDRTIRDIARRAMSESEDGLFRLIRDQMPPAEFRRIETAVLKLHANTGRTVLEWLQQPPRKKSLNALRERIERIDFLKGLGCCRGADPTGREDPVLDVSESSFSPPRFASQWVGMPHAKGCMAETAKFSTKGTGTLRFGRVFLLV